MSKTKENIIKRIALIICDSACLLVMVYMTYLCGKQEGISLSRFLLMIFGLFWFIIWILAITEFLIRGKDSLLAKTFKQAFNLVFNKLLRTDLKID